MRLCNGVWSRRAPELRPLPKTVVPIEDELLSGWLTRLACANYCDFADLLAHVGVDERYAVSLDFGLEAGAAEKIAIAARVTPELIQSLTFPVLNDTEAALTALFPFQTCPNCTLRSLALKHWRRAWAFDCQICGAMLTSTLPKLGEGVLPQKLLQHARTGSVLLEQAVMQNSIRQIRRTIRGVTFAMALKNVSGDPAWALQSFNPDIRLFCLAAVAVVQKRPLLKAALFATRIDDSARVALLRTYQKEDRLLVTVDRIGRQIENRRHASTSNTIERTWSSSRIKGKE
ncbi:hypothetical protein FY050_17025 [Phyllobacterium endophyticum]|nr:hypothetical protein FY050_17025 [Phyllobacterium endophyticum]